MGHLVDLVARDGHHLAVCEPRDDVGGEVDGRVAGPVHLGVARLHFPIHVEEVNVSFNTFDKVCWVNPRVAVPIFRRALGVRNGVWDAPFIHQKLCLPNVHNENHRDKQDSKVIF